MERYVDRADHQQSWRIQERVCQTWSTYGTSYCLLLILDYLFFVFHFHFRIYSPLLSSFTFPTFNLQPVLFPRYSPTLNLFTASPSLLLFLKLQFSLISLLPSLLSSFLLSLPLTFCPSFSSLTPSQISSLAVCAIMSSAILDSEGVFGLGGRPSDAGIVIWTF